MLKLPFVIFLLLISLFSCDSLQENGIEKESITNGVVELTKRLDSEPASIVSFQADSVSVIKVVGKQLKMLPSQITTNGLNKRRALPPFVLVKNPSVPDPIIPGEGNFLAPVIFELPSNGFLLVGEDTVFAPSKVVASSPRLTHASAMRFRDAALFDIQYLDVEQGLPSSYVSTIHEDQLGNIWFGSYAGGLIKYDGVSLLTYSVGQSLINNVIWDLHEDRKGNIWIASDGGISKYDGHSFEHYGEKQGLSNLFVMTITEDLNGNIWFGTGADGIFRLTEGSGNILTNYSTDQGLLSEYVWCSAIDSIGNIWFGTEGGLSMFDGHSFTNYTDEHGLPNKIVRSIVVAENGHIWLGTERGACVFDGKDFKVYTKKEGLSNNRVLSIHEDRLGDIWMATDGGGVSKLTLQKNDVEKSYFSFISEKEGLSNNFINAIHEDKSGNMWIGTNGGGVTKFDESSFSSFSNHPHLSENSVWSIFEDKNNDLWFGTDAWGVLKYKEGKFYSFMDEDNVMSSSIMSMLQDHDGNMWFGSIEEGLVKYDGKDWYSFSMEEGLPSNDISSILEDHEGNIWMATFGAGLIKYDGEYFHHYTMKSGLPSNVIWNILEDSGGDLWMATYGEGAFRFDGENFYLYTENEGLINNSVNSIYEDELGNIWFGTDAGVSKLVRNLRNDTLSVFYDFEIKDGLTNGIALSLIQDLDGRIWIGTESGITSLNPILKSDLKEGYELSTFLKLDGLKGLDVIINAVYKDSQNRMWWGTGKGLTMLDLQVYEKSKEVPALQLNSIDINHEPIDFRSLSKDEYRASFSFGEDLYQSIDSIVPYCNYPVNLNLPYEVNNISFHFSAIDWNATHKIQYQYRMIGVEESWSSLSDEAFAAYQNLDFGEYTFEVRSIGVSNLLSEVVSYDFSIKRPWWHMWWARIFFFALLLLFLMIFDRWRSLQLLDDQKRLQERVELRNRELELKVAERTEEIKLQQQLTLEANLVLEKKVKERTQELLDKNKKLSDYAFFNAHNVRVPVANIKGIIQLFDLEQSLEEKLELIELLKGQTNALDDVLYEIRDLLEKDNDQFSV